MIFSSGLLAAKTALVLASASPSAGIECRVTMAPAVSIRVITDDIIYDYSQPAQALSQLKTDTVSPYPRGSDTVTGGLREDHPVIESHVEWDVRYNQRTNMGCMNFSALNVTIHLRPRIFLAQEFNTGTCRDAVLGHERKHIAVDHEVMNKYAGLIGKVLQSTVDRVGSLGPFNMNDKEKVKQYSTAYVENAMHIEEQSLAAELHARQQAVDNLGEYQRVGAYCRDVRIGQ